MKKILIFAWIIILLPFYCEEVISQQAYYVLPPLYTGQTDYIARDSVLLMPGFQFSGITGSFNAKVDESITVPAVYSPVTINPSARVLDYNLPVGTIAGGYDISSSGAFTYQVPIEVPPGTGAIAPKLSVMYSSYQNSGLLGTGWHLSGLSVISRASSNLMTDGYIEEDSYLSNRFELDGMRLIPTSGIAGSPGAIYSTEIESFNRIISNGAINAGPESFKVLSGDGTVMEYGMSVNSRVTIGGQDRIYKWLLDKVTDASGNYMTITYGHNTTTGEYWPLKIDYTGNTNIGLNPYNSLKFFYEVRQDKQYCYKDGNLLTGSLILKYIKIYSENIPARTYTFNYIYDGRTYLNEILVTNADGSHYNPTVFGWDNTYSTTGDLQPKFNNERANVFLNVDFNGDGKDELLVYKKFNGYTSADKAELYMNDNLGKFSLSSIFIPLNKNFKEFIKGDFDADGDADLFMLEVTVGPGTNDSLWKYTFYRSGTGGFIRVNDVSFSYPHKPDIVTGDFDGDGFLDCLVTNTSSSSYNYHIQHFYLHPRLQTVVFGTEQGNISMGKKIVSGDFNGNGKDDILVLDASVSRIYEFDDKTTFRFAMIADHLSYPVFTDMSVQAGDFNGDGKYDIYTSSLTYLNSNKIGIFNGNSFIQYNAPTTYPTKINKPFLYSTGYSEYMVCDLNRDGKADLLEMRCLPQNGGTPSQIQAYAQVCRWDNASSPNENFYQVPLGLDIVFDGEPSHTYNCYDYLFGDFNGNGTTDLLFYSYTWDSPGIYYGSEEKIKDLYAHSPKRIVSVANGMNVKIAVSYMPLTDNTVYTKETSGSYPLANIQPAIMAVSKIVYNDGVAGDGTIHYAYSGCKMHLRGRGLLGNMGFRATDQRTGLYQSSISTVMLSCWLPLTTEKSAGSLTEGQLLKENYLYTITSPFTSVFSVLPNTKTSRNFLTNVTTTHLTDSYDAFGNPLHTTTDVNGFVYSERANSYENITSNGLYLTGRRVSSTLVSRRPGETPVTHNTIRVYDSYSNNIVRETSAPNDNLGYRNEYVYNNAGGLTAVTVSPVNPAYGNARNTVFQYDSKFRFMTTETNALDQSRSFSYDRVYGNTLTSTDYLGQTTTFTYDSFGKPVKTLFPDNNSILYSTTWATQGQPASSVFKNSVQKTGTPPKEVYYDLKGRQVQSRESGFDRTIYTDFYYNTKGLLTFRTDPYFAGDVPGVTTFLYDNLGRNTSVTMPGNRAISYTFNGLQTTTNAMGKVSSKTLDATGLLVSATDNGGTISYSYYSTGKLKKVTLPDGQETQIQYDINGNQTSLNEPNSGTTTYMYNPFGELLTQIDSKGNTTTMTYDGLGRVATKSNPDMTSTYHYHATNGLLTGIFSTNGTSKSFIYDNFGRVTQMTENIEGDDYSVGYTYNTLGDVSSITYPNGFIAKYVYNANGFLKSIINANNGLIWQNNDYTAKGQLLTGEYGNGLDLTNVYDPLGFLTVSTVSGQMPLQDFGYTYNSEGNLTSRIDYINWQNESFEYDNLNRLSSTLCNENATETISYFPNGNIYTRPDAGELGYGTNAVLPNAVVSMNLNPGVTVPATEANYTFNASGKLSGISEGNYSLDVTYGADNERVKTTLSSGGTPVKSKIFIEGLYEMHRTSQGEREICYIGGDYGAVAAYISDDNAPGSYYYIHRDHLGSITTITDKRGQVYERNHYDAWGNTCDPDDWSMKTTPDLLLGRGFTGHEHLPEFGLINMNGRCYDPVTGRFMSVDPYVQEPDFTQSYNRYSYCMNNPLSNVDISGFAMTYTDVQISINRFENLLDWLDGIYNTYLSSGCINFLSGGHDDKFEKIGEIGGLYISHNTETGVFKFFNNNATQVQNSVTYLESEQDGVECVIPVNVYNVFFDSKAYYYHKPSVQGQFPIDLKVNSFLFYPARFGDPRDNGKRKHAGCDIYAPVGTKVRAVKDGKVVRNPYRFFRNSFALEVDHGDFIARYSEIDVVDNIKEGSLIEQGQIIGAISDLSLNKSMLHFEMYSGIANGPLTNRLNLPYLRRNDLMNPTHFLKYGN